MVLACLRELEEKNGGYYGTDIINLAENLGVTWYSLEIVGKVPKLEHCKLLS
jgi:hypothetical protein